MNKVVVSISLVFQFCVSTYLYCQNQHYFNPDSTRIYDSEILKGSKYFSVNEFIQHNKLSNSSRHYHMDLMQKKFGNLKIMTDKYKFIFQEDCQIFCGQNISEIKSILSPKDFIVFDSPQRVYMPILYENSNGHMQMPDEEYFIIYFSNTKVDSILYTKLNTLDY